MLLTQPAPLMLNMRHASLVKALLNGAEQSLINTEVNRDLITATAAIAGFGSFMFGFLTNLPVALA